MTVTYTAEVATCTGLGCFLKLLRRWKGSIYKLVWLDLLLFLTAYYSLSLTYRFILEPPHKEAFENIVNYCKTYLDLIPISFVLGFYVSVVMTRWWSQYTAIPFPDPLAVFVSATVHGQDERGRVMRRTIMRYVCLCVAMTFTMISPKVKKRFPTLEHFVEAGLLQESEKNIMTDLNKKFPKYSKHWMPIVWAAGIITRARKEGRIRDDFAVKTIIDELNKFRGQCGLLISYDTISVPLVYTQVVTLAVYSYFLTTLVGHQWVATNAYKVDLYFPIFSTLQFFFYVGWLKVAETLINPFGYDDDDFEVSWMVDRNLQVSYLIVDEMHHDHPELVRDQYWDEVFPQELPYTLAAEPFRETHPLPSTANIAATVDPSEMLPPSFPKDEYDDGGYTAINFTAKPSLSRSGSSRFSVGASAPDSLYRVSSVAGRLKRLFSKDESRAPSQNDVRPDSRLGSGTDLNRSNSNLPSKFQPESMRIANQVIEEVDEQLTVTSMKNDKESHPSVIGMFGPPPPSKPVPVPGVDKRSPEDHASRVPKEVASSAPVSTTTAQEFDYIDNISIGSEDLEDDDEFTRLRNLRERERRVRVIRNLARSLSSNNPGDLTETELLLLEPRRSSVLSRVGSSKEHKEQNV